MSILIKTPYKLMRQKKANIGYIKVFGSRCELKMISNDAKSYNTKFLGYSLTSRAYKVYNIFKRIVEKSINI